MVAGIAMVWATGVMAAAPGGSGTKWTIHAADPNDDVTVVRVSGTPYQMGWWYGKMLGHEIRHNVNEGIKWAMDEEALTKEELYLFVEYIWSKMARYVPQDFHDEMLGIVNGVAEATPPVSPPIVLPDVIAYHVLVEWSEFNCTSIGAVAPATDGGRLLQIRVLDTEMEAALQDNPIITVYRSDDGPAYCNVGFAALIGSLAGINSERIAMCEVGMGTPAADPGDPDTWYLLEGVPMSLLMKKVLARARPDEYGNALDTAIRIVEDGPRTTNYGYGLGYGGHPGLGFSDRDTKSLLTTRSEVWTWGTNQGVWINPNPADANATDPNWMIISDPNFPEYNEKILAVEGATYLPHYNERTYSLLNDPNVMPMTPTTGVEIARRVSMKSNLMDVVFDGQDLKLWVAFAASFDPNHMTDSNYPGIRAAEREFVEFDFGGIMPNPMIFEVEPNAVSATSITMTAVEATDLGVDISKIWYQFVPVSSATIARPGDPADANAFVEGHATGWQSQRTYLDTGLSANTKYGFTTRACSGDPNAPDSIAAASDPNAGLLWTRANIPLSPAVQSTDTGTELQVQATIDPNDGNPAWTEYAIYDATHRKWVNPADPSYGAMIDDPYDPNTPGDSPAGAWQTRGDWGTVTITGIPSGPVPALQLKARNHAGVESPFGPPQGTEEHWTIGTYPHDITVVKVSGPPGYAMGWHYGHQIGWRIRENLDSVTAWGIEGLMSQTGKSEHDVKILLDDVWDLMEPYIPPLYIDELRGVARGATAAASDPNRVVTDSQMRRLITIVELSEFNCSAIGATGAACYQGKTIQTRNLDFSMTTGAQDHPVITVNLPDDGTAYCNVGFAGLIGVVAGLSAEQIGVSEAGLTTPLASFDNLNLLRGTPMSLLLKKVLAEGTASDTQSALDKAVQIIQESLRTSSYAYLIADGVVRDSRMLVTNRGTCDVFVPGQSISSDDPNFVEIPPGSGMPGIANVTYIPPGGQYDRVHQLLKPTEPNYVGLVDVDKAIEINRSLAMGDSCLMSVVYDLNTLIIHVAYAEDANTPANEGPFVEFDFGQFVMPIRPNPMTFEEVPTSAGPTSISMTAATATAVGVDPSQIQYRFTPADPNLVGDPGDPNARGLGTLRDWGSGRTYIDTGLAPNTRYGYQTQARIGTSPSIVTHPSDVMVACTLANPPLAPTVENATSETLDVTINPSDGNHDLTLYAIRNLTRDRWISVGGVEAFSPVWQTRAAWGTVTVLFLQADTDYQFACRARNADGVETADGPATSETTLEGGSGDDGGGDDGGGGGDGGDGTGSVQFSQLPTAVSSSSVEMWASTTWEAPNPPVQYYFEELSRNRGGSSSGWLGVAYHFDAGLEENTRYSYRVKAGDSGVPQNETPYSAVAHVYTLAAEPPAPDITNRKSNSVDVTVSRGDNPPETLLAVKNKTEGVYLDGQGRGSATEVWQVELDWGLITVDGLQPDKSYEFFCIAKNGDGKLAVGPSSLAKAATPEKGKKDPQSMTVEGDTTVNEWSQSAPYKVMAHYEDAPDEEVTARVSWELSTTQWGRITEHGGVLHAHEVFSNQQVEVRANITDAKVPVTPMRVTIVNIPGATKPVDPNEAGKLAPGDGTAGAGTDGGTAQTTPDAGPFCPFASLSISLALVGGILALRRRRA